MTKKFFLISVSLTLIGVFIEWGLSGIPGVFSSFFSIILIALVITSLIKLASKSQVPFSDALKKNVFLSGSVLGTISLIIVITTGLANAFPTSLSEVKVSDGKNTVVFIQMSHIGTPTYYDTVSRSIARYAAEGYIVYREGVTPGSPENHKKLNQLLGFEFSEDLYARLAEQIGMEAQSDRIYSGANSSQLVSVDLSVDEIIRLVGTGAVSSVSGEESLSPPVVLTAPPEATGALFPYVMRGFLNLSLRYIADTDILYDVLDPSLARVILEKRNQHVIDTLLSTGNQKVVIVYGALHFEGMYKLLQDQSKDWKILSVEPLYPYQK